MARYTKKSLRDEVIDGINDTAIDNNYIDANNNATIDINNKTIAEYPDMSAEIHIVNKRNSTDDLNSTYDVIKDIEEEITQKFTNYVPINEDNTREEEEVELKNNNVLVDLIMNSMFNKEYESTTEYNLINAAIEPSPSTKNNIENYTTIDENNSYHEENQSTMDKSLIVPIKLTEPTQTTSHDDIHIIDYHDSETHKKTTEIDTEYDLDNNDNMSIERNFIENEAATETAVMNNIDFNFGAIYGVDFNLDILRTLSAINITTTESIQSTTEFENKFLSELDEYFNSNTSTVAEITTTENVFEQNSKKNKLKNNNTINSNETESNDTESEFTYEIEFKEIYKEFTEIINQTDATTESKSDSTNNLIDTFNETNSISTLETFTTESQNMNTKSNFQVDNQETMKYYANFETTSTSDTEKFTDYETTETSKISTIKEENQSLRNDGREIVNNQEDMIYFDFVNTIANLMAAADRRRKATQNKTVVANSEKTTNYAIFNATTTTTTSPKTESKSSTAVSAKEDKVVIYVL